MVNEIFTIKKEKKAVDKLTYQLLSITDKQDNINKNMVFCTFFKRLSWKKEEAKYAEKTDKNNTLTFWILSVEASKISYAMNQFIDKKIFSANELRETFDYLKWIKTSIKSMKSEWWTVENEEDWSSYVTKDKIVITISLFRPKAKWWLKVLNILFNLDIDERNWEKYFIVKSWAISSWEKEDEKSKMKSFFVSTDLYELIHFKKLLDFVV